MKKILTLLLIFYCISSFGQAIKFDDGIMEFNKGIVSVVSTVTPVDSTLIGLMHYWEVINENSEDSATYNSTGVTVSVVVDDVVTVSDATDFYVGMDVRFTTPSSGTSYTLIDKSGSDLTFDENVTASVSDELYIACNGTFYDDSDSLNHAIQTTGSLQPFYMWLNTDSVSLGFIGANKGMEFEDVVMGYMGTFSLEVWVKHLGSTTGYGSYDFVMSHNVRTNSSVYFLSSAVYAAEADDNGDYLGILSSGTDNEWHNYIITVNSGNSVLYYDAVSNDTRTPMNDMTLSFIGSLGSDATVLSNCNIGAIRIYNRVLSTTEITDHYESGRFY